MEAPGIRDGWAANEVYPLWLVRLACVAGGIVCGKFERWSREGNWEEAISRCSLSQLTPENLRLSAPCSRER